MRHNLEQNAAVQISRASGLGSQIVKFYKYANLAKNTFILGFTKITKNVVVKNKEINIYVDFPYGISIHLRPMENTCMIVGKI
jgi:hypothetical protein